MIGPRGKAWTCRGSILLVPSATSCNDGVGGLRARRQPARSGMRWWRGRRTTRSRVGGSAAPSTPSCAAQASRPRTPATCVPRWCSRCSAAPAADLPLPLELTCARISAIARNKAIDHARRRARAPLALGDRVPGAPQPAATAGSLADGLDDVVAAAHLRRVRSDLAAALARLDAPQRAAISAHAEGGAARAAGLPRSTYYRALGHAQALLQGDLRGRLAGLGALGGIVQRAREVLAHVEAVHAAAAATTAAVAISAAVALSVHDEVAQQLLRAAARRAGRRRSRVSRRRRTPLDRRARCAERVAVSTAATGPRSAERAPARRPSHAPTSSSYDPSTYDC